MQQTTYSADLNSLPEDKVCQIAFSQKLLKTDVLELKLLEDLMIFMIKFGVNRGKEIIGQK